MDKVYKVRVWYRYNDEKDFEILSIEAPNEIKAKTISLSQIKYSFKAEFL